MNQCKPCITIRTVLFLMWKNYITDATKNFRSDYRSYSRVNATVCELDKAKPITGEQHLAAAKRIRDLYKDDAPI
jgi:hypothetical protein